MNKTWKIALTSVALVCALTALVCGIGCTVKHDAEQVTLLEDSAAVELVIDSIEPIDTVAVDTIAFY